MTAFWIDVRSLFYYFIFQFRNRRYERSGVVSSRNDICSRITQCNHTRFTFHCLKVSPPPLFLLLLLHRHCRSWLLSIWRRNGPGSSRKSRKTTGTLASVNVRLQKHSTYPTLGFFSPFRFLSCVFAGTCARYGGRIWRVSWKWPSLGSLAVTATGARFQSLSRLSGGTKSSS